MLYIINCLPSMLYCLDDADLEKNGCLRQEIGTVPSAAAASLGPTPSSVTSSLSLMTSLLLHSSASAPPPPPPELMTLTSAVEAEGVSKTSTCGHKRYFHFQPSLFSFFTISCLRNLMVSLFLCSRS